MIGLTEEEYHVLSCNKKDWNDNNVLVKNFMAILKKYIFNYATEEGIDFSEISFPTIAFDPNLIASQSINFYNCVFYGEVKFDSLVLAAGMRIQSSIFWDTVYMINIRFGGDVTILDNTFNHKIFYKNLIFEDEFLFADIRCSEKLVFENLEFLAEADIHDIYLKQGCNVGDIKGLKFFDWHELICVYDAPEYIWHDRDTYIEHYMEDNDIRTMKLAREIKAEFPKASKELNKRLSETSQMWSCYFFLEYFAEVTNSRLKSRDYREAEKHMLFMQKKIKQGDEDIASLLDVAYIENLMWNFSSREKKEVWGHIPTGIQNRYNRIWS